jgi:hypothetical protein
MEVKKENKKMEVEQRKWRLNKENKKSKLKKMREEE